MSSNLQWIYHTVHSYFIKTWMHGKVAIQPIGTLQEVVLLRNLQMFIDKNLTSENFNGQSVFSLFSSNTFAWQFIHYPCFISQPCLTKFQFKLCYPLPYAYSTKIDFQSCSYKKSGVAVPGELHASTHHMAKVFMKT